MQRFSLASLVLCGVGLLAGCAAEEVKVPKEAIPDIPAGRASQPAADGGGGPAAPAGRTPAAPK
jgi:hypothetical protein